MKLEGGIIERAMVEWRIVVTLIVVLVAVGARALLTMPRQEFPEFTIRQGLVIGIMPGASSAEIERRLAKPVEEYLFTYGEVNKAKTYSESTNGQLVVHVELREEVKGVDAPAFWVKVRHGLNELRAQKLPPNVVALIGMNDFGDTSALLLAVTAEGRSPRDLKAFLEVLEKHLRRLESTSKLKRVGIQEEVIRVTVSHERLARYGVRASTLWATLQGLGQVPADARLDTDTLEMPVHVGNVLRSEQEIGDTIVFALPNVFAAPTGANIRLKDVATITREYGHDDSSVLHDGQTAVVVSVEMRKLDDIVTYGKKVDAAIADAKRELPPDVKIWRVADQPSVVKNSVGHFLRDFGIAIVSVILVTMLLLPLRVASVAAVTIPICVFITLGVLNALGVELQTVSLAGLIVVLGMVVDNAIVIIDDHVEKLDHGLDPWTAAWQSARELFVPVFTATVAIIMAYVPFSWFMTGMGGDFLASLPVTIAVALITSMVVATLLVPILSQQFIRKGLHGEEGDKPSKRSLLDRLQGVYDAALVRAFQWPAVTIAVGVLSVVAAAVLFTHTPQQLFPKVDRTQFAVEITLPPGRPLQETEAVARRVEKELRKDPRVVDVTAFIGTSSPRFHTLYEPRIPARHRAQLIVNTKSDEATLEVIHEYESKLATSSPEGWVRLKQLDLQNSPAPVEARFSGDDIEQLRVIAARVEAHARTLPGAAWVRLDTEEPIQVVEVTPDQDSLARLGLSPGIMQMSLASTSRKGFEIGSLWEGDYRVPILLAGDPRNPESMERFQSQYVSSPLLPAAVPLEQLGRVQPAWNDGTRIRRNGTPTVTVRVDVKNGVLASTVQQPLKKFVDGLGAMRDVTVTWGGEAQDMVEQYTPLTQSLLTSVGIIYLILLFQFRRHKKALVVMLTMPLSLLGAAVGLKITGYPFGFTSFMGVIGLMGIVVRNGIILVGYAEELGRGGLDLREAAIAAGKRRMRPIFLTSAAAAVGVIPMITSRSTLWGPMGAVTCFGLLLAMVLTLLVLPVLYWLIVKEGDGSPAPSGALAGATALALLCFSSAAFAQGTPDAPLSLAQCKELAASKNVEVQRAGAELRAAEQTRLAARTAYVPQASAFGVAGQANSPLLSLEVPSGRLPVLDASGAPTGNTAYFPGANIDAAKHGGVLAMTAIQPVYAGGRVVNTNRLADVGVRAADDRQAMARRDARLEAEERYWQVVRLAEKDRTLRAYQEMLVALEREAQDAVASGLLTQNDLLKVSLERGNAAVQRLELESARRLAARDLRRFLGLPDGEEVVLADAAPPAPTRPEADRQAEGSAKDRRTEIRLLESAVEAERLQAQLKRGEGLPSLSLGVTAWHSDVSGLGVQNNAAVFAMVKVPFTEAWRAKHESAAAREKQRAAELRLGDTRRLVAEEASRAWDELDAAWNASQVADSGVESAEVNLTEKRDGYDSGLEKFSDLLEAQTLMHQAEDRRIDSRIAVALKRSAYLRAIAAE
ncbi:MAG: Multidrug resistance protein MdtC [Thermoanaerobaculia bacterium]|nr:Multidrug resistance protein MdtC [Thermoanaerobaculia bacterium]